MQIAIRTNPKGTTEQVMAIDTSKAAAEGEFGKRLAVGETRKSRRHITTVQRIATDIDNM